MASIKIATKPRQTRLDISDPKVVSAIWAKAERDAKAEVRRNMLRKIRAVGQN